MLCHSAETRCHASLLKLVYRWWSVDSLALWTFQTTAPLDEPAVEPPDCRDRVVDEPEDVPFELAVPLRWL